MFLFDMKRHRFQKKFDRWQLSRKCIQRVFDVTLLVRRTFAEEKMSV